MLVTLIPDSKFIKFKDITENNDIFKSVLYQYMYSHLTLKIGFLSEELV